MQPHKIVVIGCAVLGADMRAAAQRLGLSVVFNFLEAGLHERPDLLRQKLQAAIDDASAAGTAARIVIGYGVCGRGTVGVQSRDTALVMPRVHDCIAVFLGGAEAYRREFSKTPGTYYVSAGWHREKAVPVSQQHRQAWYGDQRVHYEDVARRYGDRAAARTMRFLNAWQKNYQRAVFIETGAGDASRSEAHAREMAATHQWRFEKIQGSPALIEQMLTGTITTDEILVVQPRHTIAFDAVSGTLSAKPLWPRGAGSKTAATDRTTTIAGDASQAPSQAVRIGLGIDAGGTYTDAVIYDFLSGRTRDTGKALTTRWDFTIGIGRAMARLDPDLLQRVEIVALSTTLATNAIVEGAGQTVGLLIMPPYGMYDPRDYPHEPKAPIPGRLSIGGQETQPVDESRVRQTVLEMLANHRVGAFAVSGFAGAINPAHELAVKRIVQEASGLSVTCGHELSAILDFKIRAATAVLNARIIPRLTTLIADLEKTLTSMGISAPIAVVKGDGTLMQAAMAKARPVETIFSGPAASVAGARHLTGLADALVVDMGGTTTDMAAIAAGSVGIHETGAIVAGRRTHVRALDIRTAGLGGDSLINRENGAFSIGPRRVAPIAWLSASASGTGAAIDYLKARLRRFTATTRGMQILTVVGQADGLELTDLEKKILDLLDRRPHSIAELAGKSDLRAAHRLSTARLEERFVIQRCGLTPTDLLHLSGEFRRWDTAAADRFFQIFADSSRRPGADLRQELLENVSRRLALEVLKRQLDEEVDPEALHGCAVCRTLIDNLFAGGNRHYRLYLDFKRPVIGIGAPIARFLPRAVELIGARAVLPENADVANAIGAITSQVVIERQVRIVPAESGFSIEGLADAGRFAQIEQADAFARQRLVEMVRELARQAGTSTRRISLAVEDQLPEDAGGHPIFIGRWLRASLSGPPDRVVVSAPEQQENRIANPNH